MQPPVAIPDSDWNALKEHGGFPEPFLKRDARFTRRWRSLRQDQLTKSELRDVARPFQKTDAFERSDPTVVPARTLLSQLL